MLHGVPVNLILNLLMLATVLVFGPRALRAAQWRAQLQAKDGVIATNEQTIRSLTERVAALEHELSGLKDSHSAVEQDLREWRARYEEMQRYAAPEALAQVTALIDARWTGVEAVLRSIEAHLARELPSTNEAAPAAR